MAGVKLDGSGIAILPVGREAKNLARGVSLHPGLDFT